MLLVFIASVVLMGGVVSGAVDGERIDPATIIEDMNVTFSNASHDPVDPANPYGKRTLVVGLVTYTDAPHEVHGPIKEALAYWEQHSVRYAGYPIEYQFDPGAEDPDVVVHVVDELDKCELHGDAVGCADLVKPEYRLPDPVVVEVLPARCEADFIDTLKHEFGHTLGLEHSDEPQSIMGTRGFSKC